MELVIILIAVGIWGTVVSLGRTALAAVEKSADNAKRINCA
jgi:hypothetical protein